MNVNILASTSVPFRPATVQVPYLALTRQPICKTIRQTSVLIDQFIALKPDSLDDVIQVLFFQKMPGYIWDVVNPKDCKNLYDLTQRCNRGWKNRHVLRHSRCLAVTTDNPRPAATPLWLLTLPRKKLTSRAKSAHRRSRPAPAPTRGSRESDGWCFYTTSVSGKPPGSAIQTAHTRKMKWPAVAASTAAADPPLPPPPHRPQHSLFNKQ